MCNVAYFYICKWRKCQDPLSHCVRWEWGREDTVTVSPLITYSLLLSLDGARGNCFTKHFPGQSRRTSESVSQQDLRLLRIIPVLGKDFVRVCIDLSTTSSMTLCTNYSFAYLFTSFEVRTLFLPLQVPGLNRKNYLWPKEQARGSDST